MMPAQRHSLVLLLIHLSPILLLLLSVECTNNSHINDTDTILPREDDSEDNRPSKVKKWFNNLISPNSERQNSKKSSTQNSEQVPPSTNHSYVPSNHPPEHKPSYHPHPVPMSPMYPMPYHQIPYMTFPYSHPGFESGRHLMHMPIPVMASVLPYSKGHSHHGFYPRSYSQPNLYMTNPSLYDSMRPFTYAIPVPLLPNYAKSYYRHNESVKYRPRAKSLKYRDKSHLEQTSPVSSGKEGEESRQLEMLSPDLEPSDIMDPSEEEYQPTQDYEEERGVSTDSA